MLTTIIKKSDPLPYCERHGHSYIRVCGFCAAEARANVGAIAVVNPLARTTCNACASAPAIVEVRFGHPGRETFVMCVALCRTCAATLRDNLETLP